MVVSPPGSSSVSRGVTWSDSVRCSGGMLRLSWPVA